MTSKRLNQNDLHSLFLDDIGDIAENVIDTGKKPLFLRLSYPFNRELKVYIFNCTAPPGGRSFDEFKIQLILDGQKRGERGAFNTIDGKTILLIGYACPFQSTLDGVWVLFELEKHLEFAYSANVQVYLRQILPVLEKNVHVCQKRNQEILVLSQRQYLRRALQIRFDIDFHNLVKKAQHELEGS